MVLHIHGREWLQHYVSLTYKLEILSIKLLNVGIYNQFHEFFHLSSVSKSFETMHASHRKGQNIVMTQKQDVRQYTYTY